MVNKRDPQEWKCPKCEALEITTSVHVMAYSCAPCTRRNRGRTVWMTEQRKDNE